MQYSNKQRPVSDAQATDKDEVNLIDAGRIPYRYDQRRVGLVCITGLQGLWSRTTGSTPTAHPHRTTGFPVCRAATMTPRCGFRCVRRAKGSASIVPKHVLAGVSEARHEPPDSCLVRRPSVRPSSWRHPRPRAAPLLGPLGQLWERNGSRSSPRIKMQHDGPDTFVLGTVIGTTIHRIR